MNTTWLEDAIMYQIYPLGLCGAPFENPWDWSNIWNAAAKPVRRIDRILGWLDHLKKLGVNALLFNPLLQSDHHGYDTRDFYTFDSRLGSNEDFARICEVLRKNNIRIVLDGVFNYVGRGFWAFRDLQRNREKSAFIDWFKGVDFTSDSPFKDGFAYESWTGHPDLVKLNLKNPALKEHIFGAIKKWIELFSIDGIRIGIAYQLDLDFLRELRTFLNGMSAGLGGKIALIAEILDSPDYRNIVNDEMLQSATNYECYKAIFSSFNTKNLFEIAYSLDRQFGKGGLYRNIPLLSFVDNHDVTRFASILQNDAFVKLGYALLYALPGCPCLYYGSEWGVKGNKKDGDNALRPAFETPEWNDLTDYITTCISARRASPALKFGNYSQVFITNEQFIFRRVSCGEEVNVAINISEYDYVVVPKIGGGYGAFEGLTGNFEDLLTGKKFAASGSITLPPYSVQYLKHC